MRIDPKEKICDYPILSVRDALRRCGFEFSLEKFANCMQVQIGPARAVLCKLAARGWYRESERDYWEVEQDGTRFLLASAAKPITRKTAHALLEKVVERAAQLEIEYPDWPVQIEKIAVFGSYLGEAQYLGDLDLAVSFCRRSESEYNSLLPSSIERARLAGFRTRSKFELAGLPFLFIQDRLRGRSRSISLHAWSDLVDLACPYKTVWQRQRS